MILIVNPSVNKKGSRKIAPNPKTNPNPNPNPYPNRGAIVRIPIKNN